MPPALPPVDALTVMALATLAGLALVGGLAAWGWNAWLKVKLKELDLRGTAPAAAAAPELPGVTQRIDLADLKERIRKLEAIAAGVDI
jgi:hypothetical protein